MSEREMIRIGEWRLEPELRRLSRGGEDHRLEPKMLDVLLLLVERAGEPVAREELERTVWSGAAVGTELLNRTVWKLRKVLGDDSGAPTYIETIPRVGYRLVAPVRTGPVDDGSRPLAVPVAPSALGRPLVVLPVVVATAVAVGLGAWALTQGGDDVPGMSAPVRIVPLTATPGYEAAPALSPDGRFVAYQRYDPARPDPDWDLAVVEIETREIRVLEGAPGADEYAPAWSPGGDSIVFVRQAATTCAIMVQARDGDPVSVASCAPDQSHEVAWAPDGSFVLASAGGGQTVGLMRLERDAGVLEGLTSPPVGFDGDGRPRVSPDGTRIAFVRERTYGIGDVYVVDSDGGSDPVRLTFDNRRIGGLAWGPAATGLIFTSNRGGNSQLWRVLLDGSGPFAVPMTGRNASRVTMAAGVTVYEEYFGDSDVWVVDPGNGGPASWGGSSRSEWGVVLSPSGDRIAFLSDRTGAAEIWVSPLAGGAPLRLTRLEGAQVEPPHWSPDGRSLVFAAATDGTFDLYTVPADGGELVRLTQDTDDEHAPVWWGGDVVYAANRTGAFELWALTPGDGPARRLTSGGGWAARPSEEGDLLYFTRADEPGLWSLTATGGRPELVWADLHPADWANWTPTPEGILYFRVHGTAAPRIERLDPSTGRVDTLVVLDGESPDQAGVTRAPDGRIFFSRVVRSESDLWMASVPPTR